MSVVPKKFPVFDGAHEFINLLTTASHGTATCFRGIDRSSGNWNDIFMYVKYEMTESYLDNT